tara:strand:- start:555 stop:680 length:126 start_codon:yes stop_codon:yes gene_type:complete
MFPTQIIGIEHWWVFVKERLKKLKTLISKLIGKSKMEKNEI